MKGIGLVLGPVLALTMTLFLDLVPGEPLVTRMAAVAVWMATWWITEAIPLGATAMLPIVLYPLLGILPGKETAPVYVNHVIFLFIGGFMIALAMEKWDLHRRIALFIIQLLGGASSRLVLSFLIASALLSMWISNTATAIMMLAIGMAIVKEAEESFGEKNARLLNGGIMLGIAYGCSVGGIATLVGTPPNLSFVRIFEITFPGAPPIGFGQWLLMALPISVVMLFVTWVLLTKVFFRVPREVKMDMGIVERERKELGDFRFSEVAVLAVFVMTAFLWVFRRDLNLGVFVIPGWSRALPFRDFLDDGTVAMTMALLMFVIPSRSKREGASRMLLSGDVFGRIPWHLVLLFGGGFALAKGFQESGLSAFVGGAFSEFEGVSPVVMSVAVSGVLTFLTEMTSNTATTEMILPILASAARAMEVNPLLLMIPATLSASCAFMMPVATPPNAIVFASGRVRILEMVRIGIVLNFVGILVIVAVFYLVGTAVLSIDPAVMPEWAVE